MTNKDSDTVKLHGKIIISTDRGEKTEIENPEVKRVQTVRPERKK